MGDNPYFGLLKAPKGVIVADVWFEQINYPLQSFSYTHVYNNEWYPPKPGDEFLKRSNGQ